MTTYKSSDDIPLGTKGEWSEFICDACNGSGEAFNERFACPQCCGQGAVDLFVVDETPLDEHSEECETKEEV